MTPHARSARVLGLLAGSMLVAAVASSCADPVHDQLVASLGPEVAGIPQGQYHRAGQPCTACHGPEGPAKTEFSLAGTIFWSGGVGQNQNSVIGTNEAIVSVVDSLGSNSEITTNCVGNFFVPKSQQSFAFPILVGVYAGANNQFTARMATQISRATSCAECHSDPVDYNSPGHIFLTAGTPPPAEVAANAQSCAYPPDLADPPGTVTP